MKDLVNLIKQIIVSSLRTRSLTDRTTGFGPVDGGSIPPGSVYSFALAKLFCRENFKARENIEIDVWGFEQFAFLTNLNILKKVNCEQIPPGSVLNTHQLEGRVICSLTIYWYSKSRLRVSPIPLQNYVFRY